MQITTSAWSSTQSSIKIYSQPLAFGFQLPPPSSIFHTPFPNLWWFFGQTHRVAMESRRIDSLPFHTKPCPSGSGCVEINSASMIRGNSWRRRWRFPPWSPLPGHEKKGRGIAWLQPQDISAKSRESDLVNMNVSTSYRKHQSTRNFVKKSKRYSKDINVKKIHWTLNLQTTSPAQLFWRCLQTSSNLDIQLLRLLRAIKANHVEINPGLRTRGPLQATHSDENLQ